jgi:hypothetical protein
MVNNFKKFFYLNKINLIFVLVGCFINLIVEASFGPLILSCFFYFFTKAVLTLLNIYDKCNKKIFNRVFSISILSSSLSSLYRIIFLDLQGDSQTFYQILNDFDILSVLLSTNYRENAFPIFVWNYSMNFFEFLGFSRVYYLPVSINGSIMATSAVLTQRIIIKLYGNNIEKQKQLTLYFTLSGFVWMFSGMLIRDSFIFILIIININIILNLFLKDNNIFDFLVIFFSTLVISFLFYFTRTEFVALPSILLIIAYLSKINNIKKLLIKSLFLLFSLIFFALYFDFFSIFNEQLLGINTTYNEGSIEESNANSLGVSFIISQPLYIRFIFGTISLLIFPMPFWSGFGQNSIYQLYKIGNLFFMVAILLPHLLMSFKLFFSDKRFRTPLNRFLVIVILSLFFAISSTSMENRHLGAFMPLFFIFSLIPDFTTKDIFLKYKGIRTFLFFSLSVIYILYMFMKLFF